MRADIRQTGKRPREAYTDTLVSIPKRFKNTSDIETFVTDFPSYEEIRRQLYRHRDVSYIPVQDPYNIPQDLKVTLRGRSVNESDENLLHSSTDGKLLKVLC